MLQLKLEGEVTKVALATGVKGDDRIKMVQISILLKAVPLDIVEDAFRGQLGLFYNENAALLSSDFEPQWKISRAIESVTLSIGSFELSDMRVKRGSVQLCEKRLAVVNLTLSGQIVSGLDKLHNVLRRRAEIELVERPLVEQPAKAA